MILDENVSVLFHQKSDYLVRIPHKKDPLFVPDLKAHLEENGDYRAERRSWSKQKNHSSLYRLKDEFFWVYIESFLKDLATFKKTYPNGTGKDFCLKWKGGYGMVFGDELTERALGKLDYLLRY